VTEREPSNWGCATLVGAVVGFSLALHLDDVSARRPVAIIVACSALAALAAWRWRRTFWEVLASLLLRFGRWLW
jgi:hypothetical protein